MTNRLAATCAVLAALSLVFFLGVVVHYQRDPVLALYAAIGLLPVVLALAGADGARPSVVAVALMTLLFAVVAAMSWPRPPVILNYYAGAGALAAGAGAVIAIALRLDVARRITPVVMPRVPGVVRPAVLWLAASLVLIEAVLAFLAFNPIGLAFVIAALGLVVSSVAAARETPRWRAAGALAVMATAVPVLALVLLYVAATVPDRRYEIAGSYRGWVVIRQSADCPALTDDRGTLVYQIDERGCGCTSTTEPAGLSRGPWSYVAISADGTRTVLPSTASGGGGLIWARSSGQSSDRTGKLIATFSAFFVGTEDELARTQRTGGHSAQEARCGIAN